MTTLQVLCRYGDDPSVGNFWVTMEELADALSAAPVNLPDVPDAVPPLYQTYKWRVDAIGGHHDNYVHGALHTSAAIPVSGDTHKQVLDALAAMTARAEAAEAKLAEIPWAALGVAMRYSPVADAVLWYQDNCPLEAQP